MIYAHTKYAGFPSEEQMIKMEQDMKTLNTPERLAEIHAPSQDVTRNYYDAGGIVTLDIIKAKLTPEQYEGFLLGQIIKYAARMNFKGQRVGDATKLAEYSRWLDFHYREGK